MTKSTPPIAELLNSLESFYGPQEPCWPTDPYLFLVWWHCGYPASDTTCAKGWTSLAKSVGVTPEALLAASPEALAAALKPGGMVPELRALRLKEIAMRVQDQFGGDLRSALLGPLDKVRRELKKFPNIADPGADRILLLPTSHPSLPSRPTVPTSWCASCWAKSARTTESTTAKPKRQSNPKQPQPSMPERALICF